MLYAGVLLPLSLSDFYHYRVPQELEAKVRVGMRCVVQFGAKRIYVGIIASLSPTLPLGVETHKVKSLGYLPDDAPIISQEEIVALGCPLLHGNAGRSAARGSACHTLTREPNGGTY